MITFENFYESLPIARYQYDEEGNYYFIRYINENLFSQSFTASEEVWGIEDFNKIYCKEHLIKANLADINNEKPIDEQFYKIIIKCLFTGGIRAENSKIFLEIMRNIRGH